MESVRGRQSLGFLQFHVLAAALHGAFSGLGAEYFAAAGFALESLAKLVCHLIISCSELLLLLFHGLAAADKLPVAALGHDEF